MQCCLPFLIPKIIITLHPVFILQEKSMVSMAIRETMASFNVQNRIFIQLKASIKLQFLGFMCVYFSHFF